MQYITCKFSSIIHIPTYNNILCSQQKYIHVHVYAPAILIKQHSNYLMILQYTQNPHFDRRKINVFSSSKGYNFTFRISSVCIRFSYNVIKNLPQGRECNLFALSFLLTKEQQRLSKNDLLFPKSTNITNIISAQRSLNLMSMLISVTTLIAWEKSIYPFGFVSESYNKAFIDSLLLPYSKYSVQ